MLIAGDVGGTKTDLAIYAPAQGPRKPLAQRRFHSADYRSLPAMVRAFMAEVGVPVAAAMSMPPCGLRASPLKKRRSPNELERRPGVGCIMESDGIVSKNAAKLQRAPKVDADEMVIVRDVPALVAALKGWRYETVALVSLFTGMRLSEVLALR